MKEKDEIEEILVNNELTHLSATYHGCSGFFIPVKDGENQPASVGISVNTSNGEVCVVYPHKIMYIGIEKRKSVVFMTDRTIKTPYQLSYWKELLDEKTFVQPHYSYIVNLNYVESVTKDFVFIRHGKNEHKVYTSTRRLNAFKKALLEFKDEKH